MRQSAVLYRECVNVCVQLFGKIKKKATKWQTTPNNVRKYDYIWHGDVSFAIVFSVFIVHKCRTSLFCFFPNVTNLNLSVVSTICLFQLYLQLKKIFPKHKSSGKIHC